MKIYYIANIRLPTEKAHGIQIMNMCAAFAKTGATVELVVPTRATPILKDPFTYYGVEKNFLLTTLRVPDLINFRRLGFIISALWFSERARLRRAFQQADFIYSRDAFVLIQYMLLGRRLVFEVHTLPSAISRFVAKHAYRVIAISKGLASAYAAAGVPSERIVVASDAVDLKLFAPITDKHALRRELDLPTDRFIVGYVGKLTTMEREKGVDDLLRSFAAVYQKNQKTFLLLVGAGAREVDGVVQKLKSFGVPDGSFSILPHVTHEQAARYMQAADALIMNYPNSAHYAHYMSPLKLFEYMASGTPIITSDLPSIREILSEKNAFFVPPSDVGALAEAITSVMAQEEEVSRRAALARRDIEAYTWDKRAQAILQFIQQQS